MPDQHQVPDRQAWNDPLCDRCAPLDEIVERVDRVEEVRGQVEVIEIADDNPQVGKLVVRRLGDLLMGAGAGRAVDFLSGARLRAPRWLQKLSLEWAYRLAQEPRRLWRRYLLDSPKVLGIFIAKYSARATRG